MPVYEYEKQARPEKAKIVGVPVEKLRDYLGKHVEAWKDSIKTWPSNVKTRDDKEQYLESRLNADVQVIQFEVEGKVHSTFFNIPKTEAGFQKSNIKGFILANGLSKNSDEWVGKEAKIIYNDDGFPQLIK